MPDIRKEVRFILNGEDVALAEMAPDQTLLDFLRLQRSLRGTKEGCAEGDCGACTVLVGKLSGGRLAYESVNACIRFLGSLDATHVVTVEHLAPDEGKLHPVQQAMVDFHGSQCGFCTPGFVMSLYALWMRDPQPSDAAIEKALQGNLCRCTGYAAIVRAAETISTIGDVGKDPLVAEREAIGRKLLAAFDAPFFASGQLCAVSVTIGYAVAPLDGGDADTLIKCADAAMYAGKQAGRGSLRRGALPDALASAA